MSYNSGEYQEQELKKIKVEILQKGLQETEDKPLNKATSGNKSGLNLLKIRGDHPMTSLSLFFSCCWVISSHHQRHYLFHHKLWICITLISGFYGLYGLHGFFSTCTQTDFPMWATLSIRRDWRVCTGVWDCVYERTGMKYDGKLI